MKNLLIVLVFTSVVSQTWGAVPNKDNLDFGTQISIAKNIKMPMSARWQALQKAAEVAKYNEITEIKKFSSSKEWYMRNATLVALQKINVNHAIEEAQMLLKDKALVVRSAAVDILANRYTMENRNLLADELSKPYNFSRKQSLWIRSKIFNVIAAKASADDRSFLTRYLFDTDEKIVRQAALSLERITDVHLNEKNKVNAWRDYVKKSGWL